MLTIQRPPYPGFEEIFPALLRLEQVWDTRLTQVGAGARNVWLELGGELRPARITRDADLAIFTTSLALYDHVQVYLVDHESFTKVTHLPHTLRSPGGVHVDLLPYGPVVSENNEVWLGGSAFQVQGLQQACDGAVDVLLQGYGSFRVITPAALLMLKLLAFDDRPTHRYHDLDDVSRLLTSGYELFLDDIQTHHWDILTMYEVNDVYALQVGGYYLGRRLKEITISDRPLHARIADIPFLHQPRGEETGTLSRALMHQYGLSEIASFQCLSALYHGFAGKAV
ncbi:MAG: hypothetical protein OHK0039_14770 [Bacteroidia bacterium]